MKRVDVIDINDFIIDTPNGLQSVLYNLVLNSEKPCNNKYKIGIISENIKEKLDNLFILDEEGYYILKHNNRIKCIFKNGANI